MRVLLILLCLFLLFFSACSQPQDFTDAFQNPEQEDEGVTVEKPDEKPVLEDEGEKKRIYELVFSDEAFTRADLSAYQTPSVATGSGSEKTTEILTNAKPLSEDCPLTLPVFANSQKKGYLQNRETISEEQKAQVKEQLDRYLSFLPESIPVTESTEDPFATWFGYAYRSDGCEIWGQMGRISVLNLEIDPLQQEMTVDTLLALCRENPYLSAALSFSDISTPEIYLSRSFREGILSEFTAIIRQEGATSENAQAILNELELTWRGGGCHLRIYTWDSTASAAEVPILSYEDAVENLCDANYFEVANPLGETIQHQEDAIVFSRLVYRNDLLEDYAFHVPCYEFVLNVEMQGDTVETTVVVPACNVSLKESVS